MITLLWKITPWLKLLSWCPSKIEQWSLAVKLKEPLMIPKVQSFQSPPEKIEANVRRSNCLRTAPGCCWLTNPALLSLKSAPVADKVPSPSQNAVEGPHSELWVSCIQLELAVHEIRGTWKLITWFEGMDNLTGKWICKVKEWKDVTENIAVKRKGCLVGRGFQQLHGTDWKEAYSPAGQLTSLRCLQCISGDLDLEWHQMDVGPAI